MKRKSIRQRTWSSEIVFLPALTPIEASVIPARETQIYGALRHVRQAFRPGEMRRPVATRMPKLRTWGPRRTER